MIDILMVDDHTIFRSGLQRLLLDEADIRTAAEAANGADALEHVRHRRFDVVLLDINMEGRNGLEVLASIRAVQPALPVLMLSMYARSSTRWSPSRAARAATSPRTRSRPNWCAPFAAWPAAAST
jgi:DNA-binding NarL/FixJ family response regulator